MFTYAQVLIAPQTSYAISLMLTHFRYTIAPSYVEDLKSIKNEVELEGMRRAYIRDGVAFVRVSVIWLPVYVAHASCEQVKFLGWLDHKISQGYEVTEWEAAFQLDEFRRQNKHFMGLAYENISAAGPNAGMSDSVFSLYSN
jgi:Xaa-Pro aminopeptidase